MGAEAETGRIETRREPRNLFVSYARKDRELLVPILEGIQRLNVTVWMDQRLEGGQSWWDEILDQIRRCDAVLVPISGALLSSEACKSERQYAKALGKSILPIVIQPVPSHSLPSDLALLQIIDYTAPGAQAAFELAGAVNGLRTSPPLPDPLPEPPGIPKSYQYDLSDLVHSPSLSLDEQLALVAQIRGFVTQPDDADWAVELLKALQQRRDLYKAVDQQISETLERLPKEEIRPTAPAGWYEDPSGRHQLRWFDKDWTSWAADDESVVDDPDF